MGHEIERKFLLDCLPAGLQQSQAQVIEQGYLALEEEGNEVRLRQAGGRYWLTVKSYGDLQRRENETELTRSQFLALWPATQGRRLQKDRYYLKQNGLTIEIDVYGEPLRGLIVAEVEFTSSTEAGAFRPLPWMGREITHLNFLKNRNLLQFDSVAAVLKRL